MISFLIGFLKFFFTPFDDNRKQLKNVKVGDTIRIEWSRIEGRIGKLKCIGNDPKTKKILLEAEVVNGDTEFVIFDYNSYHFKNFHLLNQNLPVNQPVIDENDIITLQAEMNKALEKEEYELADALQKKINKLLKK